MDNFLDRHVRSGVASRSLQVRGAHRHKSWPFIRFNVSKMTQRGVEPTSRKMMYFGNQPPGVRARNRPRRKGGDACHSRPFRKTCSAEQLKYVFEAKAICTRRYDVEKMRTMLLVLLELHPASANGSNSNLRELSGTEFALEAFRGFAEKYFENCMRTEKHCQHFCENGQSKLMTIFDSSFPSVMTEQLNFRIYTGVALRSEIQCALKNAFFLAAHTQYAG